MALKKMEEQTLNLLINQAKRLSRFIKDASELRQDMLDDIQVFERETQVVLHFEFVNDELLVTVQDRSQDSVKTFLNSTKEKLFLRASLNNVPIDVLIYRKSDGEVEPSLALSNKQIASALLELSMLVKSLPMEATEVGTEKWSLIPGEYPPALKPDVETIAPLAPYEDISTSHQSQASAPLSSEQLSAERTEDEADFELEN